jgi:hypothetical protein
VCVRERVCVYVYVCDRERERETEREREGGRETGGGGGRENEKERVMDRYVGCAVAFQTRAHAPRVVAGATRATTCSPRAMLTLRASASTDQVGLLDSKP